jgi:hypothetical protein
MFRGNSSPPCSRSKIRVARNHRAEGDNGRHGAISQKMATVQKFFETHSICPLMRVNTITWDSKHAKDLQTISPSLEISVRNCFVTTGKSNICDHDEYVSSVRFEVFTAVTMKNGVFWVVTPCGSCKNRCFGGTWLLLHQGDKNR